MTGPSARQFVDVIEAIAILAKRVQALEQQTRAMPAGLNFRGAWAADSEYRKHDVIVFNGSCWLATKSTASRPNDSQSDAWRLIARHGRDGRDVDVRPLAARVTALEARLKRP